MSRNSWNKRDQGWRNNRNQRPPGLKGREIGLYYRNLHKEAKKKSENSISLTIPRSVVTSVKNNLRQILFIAKEQDIKLPNIVTSFSHNATTDITTEVPNATDVSNDQKCNEFKSPYPVTDMFSNVPSTSSLPDFIPIYSENEMDYDYNEKQLSLRSSKSYKYAYEDIITGTFDEKLAESLSKGIAINFKDEHTNDLNVSFQEEYKDMITKEKYKNFMKFRETLPTYKKSKDILDLIDNNQVIVISGETGSGKSTQIPQIILDDAIRNGKGANVKIMVTQPRRIAASSLAARVAQERCDVMGNSVGYSVRLERIEERARGSIQFCTTGVLLVELEVHQGLTNWSHIILDEVHERDCHVDISMCMLKQVLKRRQDLKLILMSATLDAETLSHYFNDCPVMKIEGIAYPVKDVYLEDILDMTKFKLPENNNKQRKQPKFKRYVNKHKQSDEMEKDIKYKAEIIDWLESKRRGLDYNVYKTLQDSRIEELNLDLVLELLKRICRGDPGAVLIFLTGIGDISKFLRLMNESQLFPKERYEIYPLHSKLPSLDQRRIFERPPNNVRKIIVATNIAETSITIDDIVYVIDCGRIKLNGFDIEDKISTLQSEWVSQANLRQRRGRAGRCQPGICYHMMTSYRASTLSERLLPELQRSNLLEPVLTVKRLRLGLAADAFSMMPSPPAPSTVQWAVNHLQQCGALDAQETLTPLGWHLARLPLHPAAGKLLLLAALFGCLDRAASVAAVWSFKDPFQLVIGKEAEVDEVKRNFTLGEPSDHIAISEAIIQWERCRSRQHRHSFAYSNFLSNNTLELLADMKKQLGDNLKQMGFLTSGDVKSRYENRNANNMSLFKAIVAAALYPNIATVRWTNIDSRNRPARMKVYTPEEGNISLHPSSVMASAKNPRSNNRPLCNQPGANWLVYWLKQRSTSRFLLEVTLIYTLPLLFFGEFVVSDDKNEDPDECCFSIKTVKVKVKKEAADILHQLRSLLDLVLARKVTTVQSSYHSRFEEEVIDAVINLITAEDEGVEYMDADNSESDSEDSFRSKRRY
ncbi:PREDICTED: ATP-dependent RNA helicase DHX36-like [Papilio xuthus]|uniref:RNA helicase n=1 Tax=Papilio xuthus TaxID=66420 RepID=A0AAJ7EJR3_PAPXU|nr:PREDICTED: ATP-dependent RNA helicase DHX36-like [Papilio xuthus]